MGALDVRASRINEHMQIAMVNALRALAHEPTRPSGPKACGFPALAFGPAYIIPKPLDPRLGEVVPAAVARAEVESGVARAPRPAFRARRPDPGAAAPGGPRFRALRAPGGGRMAGQSWRERGEGDRPGTLFSPSVSG